MTDMELKPEDRGWNDPPIVDFCETNQSHRRGKLLNKRVAFPIQGSTMGPSVGAGYSMQNSHVSNSPIQQHVGQESYMFSGTQASPGAVYYPSAAGSYYPQQQPQHQSQPPQSSQYPQLNTHSLSPFMQSGIVEQPQPIQYHQPNMQQSSPDIHSDSMLQLNATLQNLHEVMNMLSPQILNKDEANRFLLIMQDMWRAQKLPHEVCDALYQLSGALRHGDRKHSESTMSSISTNNFDCCHEWISGPRLILQAAITESEGTGSETGYRFMESFH